MTGPPGPRSIQAGIYITQYPHPNFLFKYLTELPILRYIISSQKPTDITMKFILKLCSLFLLPLLLLSDPAISQQIHPWEMKEITLTAPPAIMTIITLKCSAG